jgi:hypothetical protein
MMVGKFAWENIFYSFIFQSVHFLLSLGITLKEEKIPKTM